MSDDAHLVAPASTTRRRLDHPTWSRWWRDLIVERYRVAAFDEAVPLIEGDEPPWACRVALGRLVDRSLAEAYGPGATSWLVADALEAAGFGAVGQLTESPAAQAAARLRSWAPSCLGNDALRLGVLGTVADALLAEVPPIGDLEREPVDLRPDDVDRAAALEARVVRATRAAVLAYARHVEDRAVRARSSVSSSAVVSIDR